MYEQVHACGSVALVCCVPLSRVDLEKCICGEKSLGTCAPLREGFKAQTSLGGLGQTGTREGLELGQSHTGESGLVYMTETGVYPQVSPGPHHGQVVIVSSLA